MVGSVMGPQSLEVEADFRLNSVTGRAPDRFGGAQNCTLNGRIRPHIWESIGHQGTAFGQTFGTRCMVFDFRYRVLCPIMRTIDVKAKP